MTIPSMLEWIESTNLSLAIREGGLPYPIIGGVHLLAIALFGGMLLASDLRLLGWVMRDRPFSDVWYQFRPWKRVGFVIVVATGLLLVWAEPVRLYGSPSFWVKMSLFALVGVHALVFRAKVYLTLSLARISHGACSKKGRLFWHKHTGGLLLPETDRCLNLSGLRSITL